MHTSDGLADIHERTHRALSRMIAHCGAMGPGAADRPLEGFAYPTVRLQIHHILGAERYWIGVLQGRLAGDDDEASFPTIASLEALRAEVGAATRAWLAAASAAELNTPRPMVLWGGKERVLVPAHVVLRTQTHVFQHTGQVAAMCRLLGSPATAMDFPLT